MAAAETEFRCFVGGLSWDTDDRSLNKAFEKYGAVDAKVVSDRETGRSRGFGFVTFNDKAGMDDAIDAMNGQDLDGRQISVNVAQPRGSRGGGRGGYGGGGGGYGGGGGGYGGSRDYGGGGGGGGGYRDRDGGSRYSGGGSRGGTGGSSCYKCGDEGHFARDCPSGDGGGGRSGGGGGGGGYKGGDSGDRYSSRSGRSGPYDRPSGDSRGYD